MPPASTFPLPLAAALLSLVAAAGCDGCHASKPYTPYTLSDAPSAAPPAPAPTAAGTSQALGPGGLDASSPEDAGPSFPAVQGVPPPGDGKSWPLEGGVTVNAPVG